MGNQKAGCQQQRAWRCEQGGKSRGRGWGWAFESLFARHPGLLVDGGAHLPALRHPQHLRLRLPRALECARLGDVLQREGEEGLRQAQHGARAEALDALLHQAHVCVLSLFFGVFDITHHMRLGTCDGSEACSSSREAISVEHGSGPFEFERRAFSKTSLCCATSRCTSSAPAALAPPNAAARSAYSPAAPLMLRWTTGGVYFGREGSEPRWRRETRTNFLYEATTMALSAWRTRGHGSRTGRGQGRQGISCHTLEIYSARGVSVACPGGKKRSRRCARLGRGGDSHEEELRGFGVLLEPCIDHSPARGCDDVISCALVLLQWRRKCRRRRDEEREQGGWEERECVWVWVCVVCPPVVAVEQEIPGDKVRGLGVHLRGSAGSGGGCAGRAAGRRRREEGRKRGERADPEAGGRGRASITGTSRIGSAAL